MYIGTLMTGSEYPFQMREELIGQTEVKKSGEGHVRGVVDQ